MEGSPVIPGLPSTLTGRQSRKGRENLTQATPAPPVTDRAGPRRPPGRRPLPVACLPYLKFLPMRQNHIAGSGSYFEVVTVVRVLAVRVPARGRPGNSPPAPVAAATMGHRCCSAGPGDRNDDPWMSFPQQRWDINAVIRPGRTASLGHRCGETLAASTPGASLGHRCGRSGHFRVSVPTAPACRRLGAAAIGRIVRPGAAWVGPSEPPLPPNASVTAATGPTTNAFGNRESRSRSGLILKCLFLVVKFDQISRLSVAFARVIDRSDDQGGDHDRGNNRCTARRTARGFRGP